MSITILPVAPTMGDPTNVNCRADSVLLTLPTFETIPFNQMGITDHETRNSI